MKSSNLSNNTSALDEYAKWQAVQDRNSGCDGIFVYAVLSTGIYCKPSCPSRRPKRELVMFFDTGNAAEASGFRPCKRCQPHQATPHNDQVELVQRACNLIENSQGKPPALDDLSRELNISSSHLHHIFKSITGLTPHQYAAAHKLRTFKQQVRSGNDVTSALYEAGYSSSSRLYENASGKLGMTPAAYRRGGKGMDILYTIVDTHLGRMLVAGTRSGICAVSFGDEDTRLEEALHSEYPAASFARDQASLKTWVETLIKHLGGSQPRLALPLDVQATTFQLRVWEELRRIPYGETRTYAEVAVSIGQPSAVRAVAHACASNPAAVVTPCHRVIRTDGGLGGYRWGLARKQALLAREHSQNFMEESKGKE